MRGNVPRVLISLKKTSENKDLLAVRAVWCEPVSGTISLINREKTGNFYENGRNRTIGAPINN